jgi:7-cyano-7-deazaguanine synthase
MNSVNQPKVLVLLSGGIDSTACAHYYSKKKFNVSAVFIDYGQAAVKPESKAAERICKHYNIKLDKVIISGGNKWGEGFIIGRNAFLLFAALMNFKFESGLIAIGVHSGTTYWDCSKDFIALIQKCFKAYSNNCISTDAPLLEWSKRDIWDYCIKEKVPLNFTYSCELGLAQPCGKCLSCKDLEKLHESC